MIYEILVEEIPMKTWGDEIAKYDSYQHARDVAKEYSNWFDIETKIVSVDSKGNTNFIIIVKRDEQKRT